MPDNQSIIIGRSPYGQQKQVIESQSVSRRHAILKPLGNGKWEIEDRSTYGTIVDGLPIIKTVVEIDTPIVLANEFSTSVRELLGLKDSPVAVQKATPAQKNSSDAQGVPPEMISVAHLQQIYDDYQEAVKNLVKKRSRAQIMRMLPMQIIMPLGLGASGIFISDTQTGSLIKGFIMFGVIGLSCMMSMRNISISNNQADEQFDLSQQFQIDYVCPKCKNFLGQQKPYKALLNQKRCPYCKAEFLEANFE